MFVEHKVYVGARDINSLKELTNTSLLSYLEDVACMHSEIAGYGISNMNNIKRTWVLLSWKIKVIKRPKFNDTLNVKTWSRLIDKFYAFRDFSVYNQDNELIAIATSKWVFIDIEKGKLIKITDEVAEKYKTENVSVFEEKDLEKLNEPQEYINKIDYKITKNMIDVNKHLHNIYYMDIAKEVLPDEISFSNETNEFEIMYKHEIKLGETVKVMYSKVDDFYYITIKDNDEKIIHAIIKLKY
jgi:medium-chain acyl-[acyl-carrier-protein] hydrolase